MSKLFYLLILVLLSFSVVAEEKFVLKSVVIGSDSNPLFTNQAVKISLLFPLFLLGVVIIMVLLDFMAIGVTIGALLVLVIGIVFKLLPLTWQAITSLVIMAIIMIYKMAT